MSANPNSWTNGDVIVTIEYSANSKVKEYSIDGVNWNAYTQPITVSENNTTIYAKAANITGDQNVQSTLTVTNIDKISPSIPTVDFGAYNPGKWTTSNIELKLTSNDKESGLQKFQYSNDGITWNDISSNYIYDYDTNQNIMFRAIDNAGNVSLNTNYYSILRDKSGPTYTSSEILNMTSNSYDIYVYGVIDIGSGVNRLQFPTWTINKGQDDLVKKWDTSTKVKGQNLGNGTWKFTVKRSDHNKEYGEYTTNVYLYDNLENYSVITINASIQK